MYYKILDATLSLQLGIMVIVQHVQYMYLKDMKEISHLNVQLLYEHDAFIIITHES